MLLFDGYCGANPKSQKSTFRTSIIQTYRNKYVYPPETREELEGFEPDFTIINACAETNAKWKEHNLNPKLLLHSI